VVCNGATRIYNHRFRCWRRQGHGRVNLHEALRHSCDIYFYELGRRLGIDRLAHYSRLLGLGAATGIDIAGEKTGLVPDRQWSMRVRNGVWYPGETISVAIGQGPLLTTPLQLAVMLTTVATGGRVVRPHMVAGLEAGDSRTVELSRSTIETIKKALWAVVNDGGTGSAARVDGLTAAGKTGTAQVVAQEEETASEDLPYLQRDHAWFVSYAPVDDPELVVVVFVEHGGHGSSAAAPLAKAIYERYFGPRIDAKRDT
jgi:penicillin-binding protein 2